MDNDNVEQPGALNSEITAITDPLLKISVAATDDPVVVTLQRLLAELKPHQAELVRRCALPRWFDAEVVAMLRDDDTGDERAFNVIRNYSFVRPMSDGRYAYHEQVRVALLGEWRAQRPDELRALHQRLADYFHARAAASLRYAIARALPTTATSANVSTPIRMAFAGRWELDDREALYHTLHADAATGMEQLRTAFGRAEATHRLGDAEALLQLARDVPLDAEAQLWVRYLRARIERAALRLDDAATQLSALCNEIGNDTSSLLAANVWLTLGEVYAETGRWVEATGLYRKSLDYFQAHEHPHEAARVQLRLGDAYQELGVNTGGWHVPAYPRNRAVRAVVQFGQKVLALPFYVVAFVLRKTPFALPKPEYLAFYQNWLLIWLYRTARDWYEHARDGFATQRDHAGVCDAEQRLAQISLIFGYADDALTRLNQLRDQVQDDTYARAWIDCDRAEALFAQGKGAEAEVLLDAALAVFQHVGDIRREAAVLALKSRIAVQRGDSTTALDGYRKSLVRFRELHYAAAREQVLHDLRAWRRRIEPGTLAQKIDNLLEAEPEKRYVARFIRSQLAWLQVLSVAAFPLTLLLLAIFAPTIRTELVQSLVRQSFYFSPWRALSVLVVLFVFYTVAYVLVALAVIFVVHFDALDREQPDYIVTDADGIACYDYRGNPVQRLRWADVRRWARYDRRLWALPYPLFSETYLDGSNNTRLQIDGITSWYTGLQSDIAQHLDAANNPVPSEHLGYTVIRSKCGASVLVGLLLILLCASTENNWLHFLIVLLPPWLYALIWLLAFSNALILFPFNYWFAVRPLALRRALGIRDWWPATVGLIGVAALILGQTYRAGMLLVAVPALGVGLMVWGAHLIAEAVATRFFPRRPNARAAIIVVALLGAAALALPLAVTTFLTTLSRTGWQRAAMLETQQIYVPLASAPSEAASSAQQSVAAVNILVAQTDTTPEQKARAYVDAGRSYATTSNYAAAIHNYDLALAIYDEIKREDPTVKLNEALATTHYNRGQALKASGDAHGWQQELHTACGLYSDIDPACQP